MRRRKQMPPHLLPAWEAFQAQAERVEAARRALLGCLPVGRVDPAPVPVGLDLIADELRAVLPSMDAWRTPEVAAQWGACRAAMDEALEAVPEAREISASTTELEEMLDAVSGVVEPLDAWHDAERHWLSLRVRPRRAHETAPGAGGAPGAVS